MFARYVDVTIKLLWKKLRKRKTEENKNEREEKIDWNLLHLTSENNRKQIEVKLEEIKKKRGQIITWSLEVEELLEGVLTNYFIRVDNKKIQFFEIEVMRSMKFDIKVQLFEKILMNEGYDNERSKKIISMIRNVQQARTKAAHWRNLVFLQKGEVRLRKKSEFLEEETLSLSDEMLKKLEEDKEYVFQEVIKFNRWFWDKEIKYFNEYFKKNENKKSKSEKDKNV